VKTDVDTCLKEIADWYIKNRRWITQANLESILRKHCESETELQKFIKFLETEPGQLRFKTLLRERKEPGMKERMPRINPHATAIQQDKQLIEQMKWLKTHGFKTTRDAQEAGY